MGWNEKGCPPTPISSQPNTQFLEAASNLLVWNGVRHVGGVDHGRDSPKERHRTVDQSEVVLLLFKEIFEFN